jgi:GT2 family glycosyltransferase
VRPLVYVLVVNWNRWNETVQCVRAVQQSTYEPARVVIIDNGSDTPVPDGRLAEVELVENGANLGYAGGNNAGIRLALERGAAYVWILNNDARPEADALAELVAAAESDSGWGALTSRIRLADGSEDVGLVGRLPRGQRWDPVRRPGSLPHSSAPEGVVEPI